MGQHSNAQSHSARFHTDPHPVGSISMIPITLESAPIEVKNIDFPPNIYGHKSTELRSVCGGAVIIISDFFELYRRSWLRTKAIECPWIESGVPAGIENRRNPEYAIWLSYDPKRQASKPLL